MHARPTLTDLNPDKYNQGLRYSPLWLPQSNCYGICNTLGHRSSKICVPTTTEDVNVNVFNIIRRIIESETLTKLYIM